MWVNLSCSFEILLPTTAQLYFRIRERPIIITLCTITWHANIQKCLFKSRDYSTAPGIVSVVVGTTKTCYSSRTNMLNWHRWLALNHVLGGHFLKYKFHWRRFRVPEVGEQFISRLDGVFTHEKSMKKRRIFLKYLTKDFTCSSSKLISKAELFRCVFEATLVPSSIQLKFSR